MTAISEVGVGPSQVFNIAEDKSFFRIFFDLKQPFLTYKIMLCGVVCTAPSRQDLENSEITVYVDKYFKGGDGISTENRVRLIRLIEYRVG